MNNRIRIRKTRVLVLIVFVVFIKIIYHRLTSKGKYDNGLSEANFCHESVNMNGEERKNNTKIFFLETSGECCLTPRQACSVESAIRTNPNATITLYMNTVSRLTNHMRNNGKNDFNTQTRSCAITQHLFKTWPNSRLLREDLVHYTKNTPLWNLVEKGLFQQSTTPFAHVSDSVRVAMLWKYGGVYLDLDCIVLKPLDSLRNTFGMSDILPNWVENGVIAFEKNHPFLRYLMSYMVLEFNPKSFISLGPATVSFALQDFCSRDELPPDQPMYCHKNISLTLLSSQAFYAVGGTSDRELFFREDPIKAMEYMENLKRDSFVSHIYDAETKERIADGSLYALLAQKYCPTTYRMALDEGGF